MTKIIVYHASYGCATGCCGHVVKCGNDEDFEFEHPYGRDPLEFAKELVASMYSEDHVKDLDWNECIISDD